MFRVKICGITSLEDARTVVAAGADAVGLNFFQKSPRYLTEEQARKIVAVIPGGVVKVGLFVNASVEEMCGKFDRLGLELIQLHGDESPDVLGQLGDRPVLRAFRLNPHAGLAEIANYLVHCRRASCLPRLVLLDAHIKGQYGGTGQVADWSTASHYPMEEWHPSLVLAGGLTAKNVAKAVRAVRPSAVDTASGVESAPGKKDAAAVAAFVQAANAALGGARE